MQLADYDGVRPCPDPFATARCVARTIPSPFLFYALMYVETSISSGSSVISTSNRDCTDSSTFVSSADDTKVTASPFVPKRPERPTRCRYCAKGEERQRWSERKSAEATAVDRRDSALRRSRRSR